VTLFAPVVVNVAAKVAVPVAGAPVVRLAAVPTTGAVPRVVPAELKVIVPVGPTPELAVVTVADKEMGKFVEALGMGFMVTPVPALVMEMASAAEVLEV
jgi:hypothetical protein